jgi:hypothetical protein
LWAILVATLGFFGLSNLRNQTPTTTSAESTLPSMGRPASVPRKDRARERVLGPLKDFLFSEETVAPTKEREDNGNWQLETMIVCVPNPIQSAVGYYFDPVIESLQQAMSSQGLQSGFSALTICEGTRRLIVYNPRHAVTRRANSVVHEISHVILEHPAAPALGTGGCRYWDSRLEDEADWQAAALLVPRDGAFAWLRAGNGLNDGARKFGVSPALFRWRVNHTGVAKQLAALGVRLS